MPLTTVCKRTRQGTLVDDQQDEDDRGQTPGPNQPRKATVVHRIRMPSIPADRDHGTTVRLQRRIQDDRPVEHAQGGAEKDSPEHQEGQRVGNPGLPAKPDDSTRAPATTVS